MSHARYLVVRLQHTNDYHTGFLKRKYRNRKHIYCTAVYLIEQLLIPSLSATCSSRSYLIYQYVLTGNECNRRYINTKISAFFTTDRTCRGRRWELRLHCFADWWFKSRLIQSVLFGINTPSIISWWKQSLL